MKKKQKPSRASRRAAPRGSARPSRNPQAINDDAWFYEYRGRIEVIVWSGEKGTPQSRVTTTVIPWKTLMESAQRCRPEQVRPNASGQPRLARTKEEV